MLTIELMYELISKRLNRKVDDLTADTLLESIGIDSLGMAELMFDLEDHLNFKLITPTNPIKTIKDVADLVDASRPK